jgi:hypothetical protein
MLAGDTSLPISITSNLGRGRRLVADEKAVERHPG